jgi:hypothetical protein
MDANRKAATSTGLLFIAATAAVLAGTALSQPALADPGHLAKIAASARPIAGGVLLELVAAFASAGIAGAMYPVLKRTSASLALGAVVMRSIEAVLYAIGAIGLLAVLTVARHFAAAPAVEQTSFRAIGDALVALREHAILAGVFAFSTGALLYYWLLFRARLVPRWLSVWGLVSIGLIAIACLSSLFCGRPVTEYKLLVAPIALQEMVLAVWLLAKGFVTGPRR